MVRRIVGLQRKHSVKRRASAPDAASKLPPRRDARLGSGARARTPLMDLAEQRLSSRARSISNLHHPMLLATGPCVCARDEEGFCAGMMPSNIQSQETRKAREEEHAQYCECRAAWNCCRCADQRLRCDCCCG